MQQGKIKLTHHRLQESLLPVIISGKFAGILFTQAPGLFSVQAACKKSSERHSSFLSSLVHHQFIQFSLHQALTPEWINWPFSLILLEFKKHQKTPALPMTNSSNATVYDRNTQMAILSAQRSTWPRSMCPTIINSRCLGKNMETCSDFHGRTLSLQKISIWDLLCRP